MKQFKIALIILGIYNSGQITCSSPAPDPSKNSPEDQLLYDVPTSEEFRGQVNFLFQLIDQGLKDIGHNVVVPHDSIHFGANASAAAAAAPSANEPLAGVVKRKTKNAAPAKTDPNQAKEAELKRAEEKRNAESDDTSSAAKASSAPDAPKLPAELTQPFAQAVSNYSNALVEKDPAQKEKRNKVIEFLNKYDFTTVKFSGFSANKCDGKLFYFSMFYHLDELASHDTEKKIFSDIARKNITNIKNKFCQGLAEQQPLLLSTIKSLNQRIPHFFPQAIWQLLSADSKEAFLASGQLHHLAIIKEKHKADVVACQLRVVEKEKKRRDESKPKSSDSAHIQSAAAPVKGNAQLTLSAEELAKLEKKKAQALRHKARKKELAQMAAAQAAEKAAIAAREQAKIEQENEKERVAKEQKRLSQLAQSKPLEERADDFYKNHEKLRNKGTMKKLFLAWKKRYGK